MAQEDAIARLARQIEAARKAEHLTVDANKVAELRRQGACELHRVCAAFVASLNRNLSDAAVELSPEAFAPDMFREAAVNLIQVSWQGREMQIAFEAPAEPVSTEKFLVPYILEGEIRAFNQTMLEHFEIRSRALYYCVEQETASWRFYDWRTLQTGPIDGELLAHLMESLF